MFVTILLLSVLFVNFNVWAWKQAHLDKELGKFIAWQVARLLLGAAWGTFVFYVCLVERTWDAVVAWYFLPVTIIQFVTLWLNKEWHIYDRKLARNMAVSFPVVVICTVLGILFWLLSMMVPQFMTQEKYALLDVETFEGNMAETDADKLRIIYEPTGRKSVEKVFSHVPDHFFYTTGKGVRSSVNGEQHLLYIIDFSDPFRAYRRGIASPGYGLVDTRNTSIPAEMHLDENIWYTPSQMFDRDIDRHVRFRYPSAILFEGHFEPDDEWNLMYILPYGKHKQFRSAAWIEGAFVVNPTTGEIAKYDVEEMPDWVD